MGRMTPWLVITTARTTSRPSRALRLDRDRWTRHPTTIVRFSCRFYRTTRHRATDQSRLTVRPPRPRARKCSRPDAKSCFPDFGPPAHLHPNAPPRNGRLPLVGPSSGRCKARSPDDGSRVGQSRAGRHSSVGRSRDRTPRPCLYHGRDTRRSGCRGHSGSQETARAISSAILTAMRVTERKWSACVPYRSGRVS